MTKKNDSIAVADVFQAFDGTSFPATTNELLESVEEKRGTDLFPDKLIDRIEDFFEYERSEAGIKKWRNPTQIARAISDYNGDEDRRSKFNLQDEDEEEGTRFGGASYRMKR